MNKQGKPDAGHEDGHRVLEVFYNHFSQVSNFFTAKELACLRNTSPCLRNQINHRIEAIYVVDGPVARAGLGGLADATPAADSPLPGSTLPCVSPLKLVLRLQSLPEQLEAREAYVCAALSALGGTASNLHHLVLQSLPLTAVLVDTIVSAAPHLSHLGLLSYPGCNLTRHDFQALASGVGTHLQSVALGGEVPVAPEILECLRGLSSLRTLKLTGNVGDAEWFSAANAALPAITQLGALTIQGLTRPLRLPDMAQNLAVLHLPDTVLLGAALKKLQGLGGLTRLCVQSISLQRGSKPLPPQLQSLELSEPVHIGALASLHFPKSMRRLVVPGLAIGPDDVDRPTSRLLPDAATFLERALAAVEQWLAEGDMPGAFELRCHGWRWTQHVLPPASWGGSWAPLLASLGRLCEAGRCPWRLRFEWGLDGGSLRALAEHLPRLRELSTPALKGRGAAALATKWLPKLSHVTALAIQDIESPPCLPGMPSLAALALPGMNLTASTLKELPNSLTTLSVRFINLWRPGERAPLPPRLQFLELSERVTAGTLSRLQFPSCMQRLVAPGLELNDGRCNSERTELKPLEPAASVERALAVLERWLDVADMQGAFGLHDCGKVLPFLLLGWDGSLAPLLASLGRLCAAGRCPPRLRFEWGMDGGSLAAVAEHLPRLRELEVPELELDEHARQQLARLPQLERLVAQGGVLRGDVADQLRAGSSSGQA